MKIQSGVTIPPWMLIAQDDIGVRELRGPFRTHPRIRVYHETTSLPVRAHRDEVPWCSSAVNTWIEEAGLDGTGSALARSWLSWGLEAKPLLGAVTVIRRRDRAPDASVGARAGYHVGLFAGQDDHHIRLLGGNQGNRVRYRDFPLDRWEILAYRMPTTPTGAKS